MNRLAQGEVIEGRYRVDRLIATGGQANVYQGIHLGLERPVAIKVLRLGLPPELLRRTAKRFEQEARLLAALRDPHTITLYDFGHLPDGTLYMVFEYVEGQSLKQVLATEGPLRPWRIAKILKQTCASLQEAHQLGVLHRDIKPANIMLYNYLGRLDLVKLLDFGIAKILEESRKFSHESLTGAKGLIGTPRYIPPEAYDKGQAMTAASDIYSLGLVMYELIVGTPAIQGSTAIDIYRVHMERRAIRLPPQIPLPLGLQDILHTMLEHKIESRYQRVDEILWDLQRWKADEHSDHTSDSLPPVTVSDPEDLLIPDPYDEVCPTQSIGSDSISQILLDHAPSHHTKEAALLDPETSPFFHALDRDARTLLKEAMPPAATSLPDQDPGAVTVTRPKHIGQTLPPQGPLDLTRDASAHPRALLDAHTQILRNTSDIDALLFLQDEADSEVEDGGDPTQNIALKDILAQDLAAAIGAIPPGITADQSDPFDPTEQVKVTPTMRHHLGVRSHKPAPANDEGDT